MSSGGSCGQGYSFGWGRVKAGAWVHEEKVTGEPLGWERGGGLPAGSWWVFLGSSRVLRGMAEAEVATDEHG